MRLEAVELAVMVLGLLEPAALGLGMDVVELVVEVMDVEELALMGLGLLEPEALGLGKTAVDLDVLVQLQQRHNHHDFDHHQQDRWH